MTQDGAIQEARSLTVRPSWQGRRYQADVAGPDGASLGSVDEAGTVRDASGAVVLQAPVLWEGKRRFVLEFSDAHETLLGQARVLKSFVGPRVTRATVGVSNGGGEEILRAEPDKKGEHVRVLAGDQELATIEVTRVKTGFMRKSRVLQVGLSDEIPARLRPLVLGVALRYDGVLNAVTTAAAD